MPQSSDDRSRTAEGSDLGPETGTSTEETERPNLSTEHQQVGDARLPNDRLDKDQPPPADDGGRKSTLTKAD